MAGNRNQFNPYARRNKPTNVPNWRYYNALHNPLENNSGFRNIPMLEVVKETPVTTSSKRSLFNILMERIRG